MDTVSAKSILTRITTGGQWFGIDYNINLYRGCNHGCIYCDSRSDCYHIDNFDHIRVKANSIAILEREMKTKRNRGVIGIGAMSDTYNCFERETLVTRQALTLVSKYGYGIAMVTKSNLITRDIDLLQKINAKMPVICKITITTASDELAKVIEPNAPLPSERFEAVRMLSEAGIYTGILLMPVLPFITDDIENIMQIVKLSTTNKAKFIYPFFGVTLRSNQRDYFYDRLHKFRPELCELYSQRFGQQYCCDSPNRSTLSNYINKECSKNGIATHMQQIISEYKRPRFDSQLSLF